MATRIFCDHCGNTITKPNVFCYGPWSDVQVLAYGGNSGGAAVGSASGGGSGSANWVGGTSNHTYQSVAPVLKLVKVDLCDVCVPIWLERVRNLTKASDPDV